MAELPEDWQLWLATSLLREVAPSALIDQLVARGVSAARASSAVAAMQAHPLFRVALPIAETLRRREALLLIRSELSAPTLARIATLSRERFLLEFYAVQQPVVVTAFAQPRALERWTFDYLATTYGALEIELQDHRDRGAYQRDFERFCTRTTLGALLERIDTPSNAIYLTAKNRLLSQPGAAPLLEDLQPLPDLFACPDDAAVWIGPAGTITPLHHDWINLAIVQLRGKKRVHLVPAWEASLVGNTESRFADHRPAQTSAHVLGVDLAPGDVLFVPVGWFHEVHALEPSISVTLTNFGVPNHYEWNTDTRR